MVVSVKSAQAAGDVPSIEELKALQIAKEAIMSSPKPPVDGAADGQEKKVLCVPLCFPGDVLTLFFQERKSTWRKSLGADKGISKRRDSKGPK